MDDWFLTHMATTSTRVSEDTGGSVGHKAVDGRGLLAPCDPCKGDDEVAGTAKEAGAGSARHWGSLPS